MKTRFNVFFRLLFLREHFKFYLNTALICYLYFIIHRRAQNAFGTLWQCLFWQVYCWWPLTWQEIMPELFQKYYALCDGVLGVFTFQGVLLIIN